MRLALFFMGFLFSMSAVAGWDEADAAYKAGDYATAYKEWKTMADQGYAAAQNKIGELYEFGWGVTRDYAEATRWYKLAAEQGDPSAQINLGNGYRSGYGSTGNYRSIRRNFGEAVRWYKKADEQGDIRAAKILAKLYQDGEGDQQDRSGDSLIKNIEEAIHWYRRIFELGDESVTETLGELFDENGDSGEAVRWYQIAANKGNVVAQNNLGVSYMKGDGVRKDPSEAVRWYRKAAEAGNQTAQMNLAALYSMGAGNVQRDYSEAAKWWRIAADKGNPKAAIQLGRAYEKGRGVPQDYFEAVKLYQQVVEKLQANRYGTEMSVLLGEAIQELNKNAPQEFLEAKDRLRHEQSKAEQAKRDAEEAKWNERLAELKQADEAELSVSNKMRTNLQSKKFRQSFKTSSACRDFEKQSNAMIARLEAGLSHPNEGRRLLSDIAVSFDACSRSKEFGNSKLRDAYVGNFNGLKLMQSVWERGVSLCEAADRMMQAYAGSRFNNCQWIEMPLEEYEGKFAVRELKSSVVGFDALIERESERDKYRKYFGQVYRSVGERLIRF